MRRRFSASPPKRMPWKEQLGAPGLRRGGAEKRMAVRLSVAGCEQQAELGPRPMHIHTQHIHIRVHPYIYICFMCRHIHIHITYIF